MENSVLKIDKEIRLETVYAIMLPDNGRALNLTEKMAFKLEYLSDWTAKGILDLKEEISSEKCPVQKSLEAPTERDRKTNHILEKEKRKKADWKTAPRQKE